MKKILSLILAVLILGSSVAFAEDGLPAAEQSAAESGVTMLVVDTGTTAESPAVSDGQPAAECSEDSATSEASVPSEASAEEATLEESIPETAPEAPEGEDSALSDVSGGTASSEPSDSGQVAGSSGPSLAADGSGSDVYSKVGSQSDATIYINNDWTLTPVESNDKYSAISFTFYSSDNSTLYEAYITGLRVDYTVDEVRVYVSDMLADLADSFYAGNSFTMSNGDAFKDKYWVSVNPVDAEKAHSKPTDDYPYSDDLLCWAASTSNILELSGWGKEAGFSSEDEIFAYFEKHFTDVGSTQTRGLKWFFDGINDAQITKDGTAVPAGTQGDSTSVSSQERWTETDSGTTGKGGGLLQDYSSESIATTYDFRTASTDSLYDAAMKLKDGQAATISVAWIDDDAQERLGGHAITLLGYIRDTLKSGLDSLVSLFISDSDNNYDDEAEPAGKESAHEAAPNSVTMYLLKDYNVDGNTLKQLAGFASEGQSAPITDVSTLVPYSSSLPKETTEGDTKDPVTTIDYIPESISVLSANNQAAATLSTGDTIKLSAQIKNMSYAKVDLDKFPNPYIYATYTIYCDGEVVNTLPIISPFDTSSGYGINALSSVKIEYPYSITLDRAGNYEVDFTINGLYYNDANDGLTYHVFEAYSGNNTLQTRYKFTVEERVPGSGSAAGTDVSAPVSAAAVPVVNAEFDGTSSGSFSVALSGITVSEGSSILLYLDNELIDPANYTLVFNSDGTVTVVFTQEFIKNLFPGLYDVLVTSDTPIAHISMRIR